MKYNIGLISGKDFVNTPASYTEPDFKNYSPRYMGDNYDAAMSRNKSLFDKGVNVDNGFEIINPMYTSSDINTLKQLSNWNNLQQSINNTRTTGARTKLIGLDFETLRVNNAYALNNFAAITEIGITETTISKNSINDVSHSIALGINENQLTRYLSDVKMVKEQGFSAFDYADRQMIQSTMERASRYSGNITDIYQKSKITRIGSDIVTVKNLSDSMGLNLEAVESGLINESVLGGLTAEQFEAATISSGYNIDVNKFIKAKKQFESAGLKPQTLDTKITKNLTLRDRIDKFFEYQGSRDNTYITSFNGNQFDAPIYSNLIGNGYTVENSIDSLSGIQFASDNKDLVFANKIARQNGVDNLSINRKASLEGFAYTHGLTFGDVAHNGGSDTMVNNRLLAMQSFYNGKSLSELVTDNYKPTDLIPLDLRNNYLYALNSIAFDKNGLDYLNSNRFNVSGINRGRYYIIDSVKQYEDNGKIGVKFLSASDNSNDEFIKVYDSMEDMQYSLRKNFLFDKNVSQDVINKNDIIVNADKARRNYENLYDISSISYNLKDKTYDGGFEKLNKYYNAYKISSEKIPTSGEYIKDIAETNKYDDIIEASLREALEIPEDKNIPKSTLRDFKAIYGRLEDESGLIKYATEQFEGEGLNNYQKTIAFKKIRDNLTDSIEGVKDNYGKQVFSKIDYTFNDIENITRRDLFNVDINVNGVFSAINFENRENATDTLVKLAYGSVDNKTSYNAASTLLNIVNDLNERRIVNIDFLKDVYNAAGIANDGIYNKIKKHYIIDNNMVDSEISTLIQKFNVSSPSSIQPRKIADLITSEMQNQYIQPLKSLGYDIDSLSTLDIASIAKDKKFSNFLLNAQEEYTGASVLTKAIGNKYNVINPLFRVNLSDGTHESFKESTSISRMFEIFRGVDETLVDSTNKEIINSVKDMSFSLNPDEIKSYLMDNLHYSEESADRIGRSLFLVKGKNEKTPYGFTTYKGDNGKSEFITQFAYSGKEGEDAFVLLNLNGAEGANGLSHTMEIMSQSDLSFKEKMNLIRENNYSAVLKMPAIHEHELVQDETKYFDEFLQYTDLNGNKKNYKFNTIDSGEKGYQKISQFKTYYYDTRKNTDSMPIDPNDIDKDSLKYLDIYLSDDVNEINSAISKNHNSILETLRDETLSVSERYEKVSKMYKRAQDKVIIDMPGPSGYQALFHDGKFKKVLVPDIADITKSSQFNIEPFQLLALETAKMDAIAKHDLGFADSLAKFSYGYSTQKVGLIDTLNSMINKVKNGESLGSEFDEFFLKHFVNSPMSKEKGTYSSSVNSTIFGYIEDASKKYDNLYSAKTKSTIKWLSSNKEKISQIVSEKATHDMKVSLINSTIFNPHSTFDVSIRPTNVQQGGGRSYRIDRVTDQLKDVAKKLDIRIGDDASPIQKAILKDSFKDYEILEGIKYGDLSDTISANVRQMDSANLISNFVNLQNDFDNFFEDVYKNSLQNNGLTKEENKYLMQEALNIVKNTGSNLNESRGVMRPSVASSDFAAAPNIRTVEINPLEEGDLNVAYEFIKATKKSNGYIETGTTIPTLTGVRTYDGPSGHLTTDVTDFLLNGKGHLIEEYEGVSAVKMYIGNEKMTVSTMIYDSSDIYKKFTIGRNADYKNLFRQYTDFIYDKVFGEGVTIAADMPLAKHGSGGNIYGGFLNTIFNEINKEIDNTGNTSLINELHDMFYDANPNGIEIINYNGKLTYDESKMGHGGAFTQVEDIINDISKRAEKDPNSVWKKIIDKLDYNKEHNISRTTLSIGPNVETMGGAMNLDPRLEQSLRTKFHEEIVTPVTNTANKDFNSVLVDGKPKSLSSYVTDYIKEESLNGVEDTSLTPVSKIAGKQYESAQQTVQGIIISTDAINNPEKLAENSHKILDINLDDIIIAPAGSDADELSKTGFYKIIDSKGAQYSEELKRLANGKNLNEISALRIHLGNGIGFDNFSKNGKGKINELVVPLYDITPVKGEIQYNKTIRDLNNALRIAKDFGSNGLETSQKDLNTAVQTLYTSMVDDLMYSNKDSYVTSRLAKYKMKNSGMLHANSTIVPTVNEIVNNYSEWIKQDNVEYRNAIIDAVRRGDASNFDIDVAGSLLSGTKYTTIRDGKMYYDNIVEMSKQGLIDKGLNFSTFGEDLFFSDLSINKKEILDSMQTEEFKKMIKFNNTASWASFKKDVKKGIVDDLHFMDDYKTLTRYFETLAENKLTTDGITSIVVRYPTFNEASVNFVRVKLNNTLSNKEMNVSGPLGLLLNMDHDGDKGVIKLFLDKKGSGAPVRENSIIGKALNKLYEMSVYSLVNNNIYADLLQKQSDKITNTGSAVDIISDYSSNIEFKRSNIDKYMQESERNEILSKLNLNKYIDTDVEKLPDNVVKKVFKEWDNRFGNMLKNVEVISAAIKAKETKTLVGPVSNINFLLNESLYEAMNNAFETSDTSRKKILNEIKNNLHIRNEGLLPVTEQKAIDVKHVSQGLSISETQKYAQGIRKIFTSTKEDDINEGKMLIRKAMEGKDIGDLDKQLNYLVQLSNDSTVRGFFNKNSTKTSIDDVEQALSNRAKLNDFIQYAERNNLSVSNGYGVLYREAVNSKKSLNMGFKHDGVFQDLSKDSIYVSVENGKPIVYQATNNLKIDKKGNYILKFNKFDLLDGKYEIKNGVKIPVFEKGAVLKSDDINVIEDILQKKFGDFRKYTAPEFFDVKTFTKNIRNKMTDNAVLNYASLYSHGNTAEAASLLEELKKNKRNNLIVNKISNYKEQVDNYIRDTNSDIFKDFIDKVKFIKNNRQYQLNPEIFKNNPFVVDDLLTDINRQIINKGKATKTSTNDISKIFDNIMDALVNTSGKERLNPNSNEFKNVIEGIEKNVFKDYDSSITDISKAEKELSIYKDDLSERVNDILENLRNSNAAYTSSAESQLRNIVSSKSDLDNIFNWTNDLANMRVGISDKAGNGYFGRQFKDLTSNDIDNILKSTLNENSDELNTYAFNKTKENLKKFLESNNVSSSSSLNGVGGDILKQLNQEIIDKGAKAAKDTVKDATENEVKETLKNKTKGMVNKTLGDIKGPVKNFIGSTPGKFMLGLAALGMANNLIRGNSSPLSPSTHEQKLSGRSTNGTTSKAPSSQNERKVYVSNGVHYKMSAKSKDKISHMQMGNQLSTLNSGDTQVNVYDDKTAISNNWLERKFSEMV